MCVTLFFRPRGAFHRIAASKKKTGLLVVMFKELNAKRHLTVNLKKEKPERWDKQRSTVLVCNIMCLWHDHLKKFERRKKRDSGLNFDDVQEQSWETPQLTCCRWCRRHYFPPHTAPVLGKHAEPVEQSAPGKIRRKSLKLLSKIWLRSCKRAGGNRAGMYLLLLNRHLLGGAGRLDRHGGLERDSGGGVSACFRGLHGAWMKNKTDLL